MAADADGVADPDAGLILVLPLGADPATPGERRGREHFYDGDNSLHARTSCNHCHAGGGMDLIGWDISDFPHDHKTLMVTQSLKSIEDTFPYHWRGERDLEAFNGAFSGLLGGEDLDTSPGGELDDFKAFVFSLQAHANPVQDRTRQLNPARSRLQAASDPPPGHGVGDPIAGQPLMDAPEVFIQRFSCADCHGKVAGTVGDVVLDGTGGIPANLHMDTSHFRHLFHKNQDLVDASVTLTDGTPLPIQAPRGGYGISHDGNHPSTFDFIDVGAFKLDDVEARDLAAFIEQADHGISPAAHLAFHVDRDTPNKVLGRIESLLLDQVAYNLGPAHWVDVALIGTHRDAQGAEVDLRWAYDHGARLFRTDVPVTFPDGSVGTQSWTSLRGEVAAGRASFTVLGLPPNNGHRFSLDRDDDGLEDYAEGLLGTDPFDPDSDGDGDPDGHEADHGGTHLDPGAQANDTTPPAFVWGRVDHVGASFAKLVVEFSEPVALKVTATESVSGHAAVEQRYVFRRVDTITVPRLAASMPTIDFPDGYPVPDVAGTASLYSLDLEMTDLSGNVASFTVGNALETRDLLVPNPFRLSDVGGVPDLAPALLARTVTELAWSGSPQGGTLFRGTARVAHRFDVPEVLAAYANPPNTPNGSSAPNERQVLVAQVLHFDAALDSWSVLPTSGAGLTVSAPPDRLQATISLQGDANEAGDPPPPPADLGLEGPFLLSSASDATGGMDFEFTLSQPVGVDDRVSLNVVAILEQDTRDAPVPANEFWRNSSFSYSKPITDPARRSLRWPD